MKKLMLIFLMALAASITNAQTGDKAEQQSKAEKFSTKAGSLIQKEFLKVGTLKKVELQVIHYTDLLSLDAISSLRFEYETTSTYSSDTKIASLDADEIDGLIKSIKLMEEKVFSSIPTNYTEVTFCSRSGFSAGCFWSKGKWSAYLKLKKYDSKSYVFLKKEEFPALLALLEKAKGLLI